MPVGPFPRRQKHAQRTVSVPDGLIQIGAAEAKWKLRKLFPLIIKFLSHNFPCSLSYALPGEEKKIVLMEGKSLFFPSKTFPLCFADGQFLLTILCPVLLLMAGTLLKQHPCNLTQACNVGEQRSSLAAQNSESKNNQEPVIFQSWKINFEITQLSEQFRSQYPLSLL